MNKLLMLIIFVLIVSLNAQLSSYDNIDSNGYRYNDPNHNTLFIIPSAETNPKNTGYLSNYELFYMNVGYVPVENLHLSVGFLFPITPEFISEGPLSIGAKYRLAHQANKFNISVLGSYTFSLDHDYTIFTFGGAANYYLSPILSGNIYIGTMLNPQSDNSKNKMLTYGLGVSLRTGESSKFIIEYLNAKFENYYPDGVLMVGFRFFGKKISVDLAGITILDFEDWLLLPFLNFTYHF